MSERTRPAIDPLKVIEVALLARRYAGLQIALIKLEAKRRVRKIVTAAVLAVIAGFALFISVGLGAAAAVSGLHEAGHSLTASLAMVGGGGLFCAVGLILWARHLLRKTFEI